MAKVTLIVTFDMEPGESPEHARDETREYLSELNYENLSVEIGN